jgi:hypothetical protein
LAPHDNKMKKAVINNPEDRDNLNFE